MAFNPDAAARAIVFARISDELRCALGPVLDDKDDLAALAGVDPPTLTRVIEGVPRPLNGRELAVVRRLAYLIAYDDYAWTFPLVAIETAQESRQPRRNIPARAEISTEPHELGLNTTSKENER